MNSLNHIRTSAKEKKCIVNEQFVDFVHHTTMHYIMIFKKYQEK